MGAGQKGVGLGKGDFLGTRFRKVCETRGYKEEIIQKYCFLDVMG